MITIYVGPERKDYQIHKRLLASYKYWRRQLDPEDAQIMHLPHHSPDTWDHFVNWLYRGSLRDICVEKDIAETQAEQYVYLYSQAERWAIPALQNKIMDKICAWTTRSSDWPPCNLIDYMYEHTVRGSPLRSYVVDSLLSKSSLWDAECENGGRVAELETQLDYGNHKFVLECFETVMQSTSKSKLRAPDRNKGCTYHKHEDGEKCIE